MYLTSIRGRQDKQYIIKKLLPKNILRYYRLILNII
jgi:hypothetical protein